jgi:hypothetical protein
MKTTDRQCGRVQYVNVLYLPVWSPRSFYASWKNVATIQLWHDLNSSRHFLRSPNKKPLLNHTITAPKMIDTDTKTTEYAKLFDFFEHLASCSQQPRNATVVSPKDGDINDDSGHADPAQKIPAPLLKDLETFLATRVQHHTYPQPNTIHRPPRNTADPSPPPREPLNEEDPSTEETVPRFPLEEKYPFTFKLMIHKLYELREWAAKVKEVVEKSQKQFKPLSEKEVDDRKSGGIAKEGPVVASERKGTMPLTSKRSNLAMATAKTRDGTVVPAVKPTGSGMRAGTVVLKKRCIGRRKSTGGPSGNANQVNVGWSYDAAASSVESIIPNRHARSSREVPLDGHRGEVVQLCI